MTARREFEVAFRAARMVAAEFGASLDTDGTAADDGLVETAAEAMGWEPSQPGRQEKALELHAWHDMRRGWTSPATRLLGAWRHHREHQAPYGRRLP